MTVTAVTLRMPKGLLRDGSRRAWESHRCFIITVIVIENDGYRVTLTVPAHPGAIGAVVVESPEEIAASAVGRSGSPG